MLVFGQWSGSESDASEDSDTATNVYVDTSIQLSELQYLRLNAWVCAVKALIKCLDTTYKQLSKEAWFPNMLKPSYGLIFV